MVSCQALIWNMLKFSWFLILLGSTSPRFWTQWQLWRSFKTTPSTIRSGQVKLSNLKDFPFSVFHVFMNSIVEVGFPLKARSWGSCDFCCKQIIAILLEKYFCSDYYRGSILQLLTVPEQALWYSIKRTRRFKYGKEDIDVYSFKLWQEKYDWFIPDILHNKSRTLQTGTIWLMQSLCYTAGLNAFSLFEIVSCCSLIKFPDGYRGIKSFF